MHKPAIDEVGGSRAIASLFRGQPGNEIGDFSGLCNTAQGYGGVEASFLLWVRQGGSIDGGVDGARSVVTTVTSCGANSMPAVRPSIRTAPSAQE